MAKNTQAKRLLHYIAEYGSVTRYSAMNDIGIANLTALVSLIRKQGLDSYGYSGELVSKTIDSVNRYGEKCRYTEYSIVTEAE